MIDERHEELAALHALDLLAGAEREAFERELAADADLRALVDSLRESSIALAHTAPDAPLPAALKARILASASQSKIENLSVVGSAKSDRESKIIPGPWSLISGPFLPWAAAACFALLAAWLGSRYLAARSEAGLLATQQAIADLALQSARNQLEAERLLARQQVANLNQQVADATRQLADSTSRLAAADQLLARTRSEIENERTATAQRLADLDRQLAAARASSGDAARDLAETRRQLAARDAQLREQAQLLAAIETRAKQDSNLANFKIAALTSMLKGSPQALAVAVWNPAKQEGVFTLEKTPALKPDQSLELWVVEAKEGAKPVSAGVFPVGADGTARLAFKPAAPVGALAAFAVSREKNDGARAHAAPAEVIMLGKSN